MAEEKMIDPMSGLEIRRTDNTRKDGDPELPSQEPKPLELDDNGRPVGWEAI